MMPGMMPGMPMPAMPAVAPGAGGDTAPPQPPQGPPTTFVLAENLFNPEGDDELNDPHFFSDLKEDVAEEVAKHGDIADVAVLPKTAGHFLFRFRDEEGAARAAAALNGRWFGGKQVKADTIAEEAYEEMLKSAGE
mmetsp:Transcript_45277/g.118839  ORF Transcript_45277/g.118839 Transcript_45277/m.118839 type:complete len:136 (-) Transcript_45277:459-866(-)